MRRLLIAITLMLSTITIYPTDDARTFEIGSEIQFGMHDISVIGYRYPTFTFSIIMPDGTTAGWDGNANQWTESASKSEVIDEAFNYPDPGQECTSHEPEVIRRKMLVEPEIEIEYTTRTALYCKNILSDTNTFIGSGYGGYIDGQGVSNGKYLFIVHPIKIAVINTCFSYSTSGKEPHNSLCTDAALDKTLILTPGIEQTIEFTYNYTDKAANKVEKVVTPATLSGSWESCNSLGMIKNRGLYNSIKQKLDNASKKTASGDQKAAANIYSAVANELKAQYGKGIDAMCADILLEDLKGKTNQK